MGIFDAFANLAKAEQQNYGIYDPMMRSGKSQFDYMDEDAKRVANQIEKGNKEAPWYDTEAEQTRSLADQYAKDAEEERLNKQALETMRNYYGEEKFNEIDPWDREEEARKFRSQYGDLSSEEIMNGKGFDQPAQAEEQTVAGTTNAPINNGADPETGVIPAGGYISGGIENRNFNNESAAALQELFGDKYADFGTFAFNGDIDDWRKFLNYGNIRDWYARSGAFNENGDFDEEGYNNYFNSHRNGNAADVFSKGYAGTDADVARQYFNYMANNGLGWMPGNDETALAFSDLIKKNDGLYDESSIDEQVDNIMYEYLVNMAQQAMMSGDENAINQFVQTFGSDLENMNKYIKNDAYKFVNADDESADVDRYNEFAQGYQDSADDRLNRKYYEADDKSYYVPINGGLDPLAAIMGSKYAVGLR